MVKNLEQWLDEFVDNGADAKDVTNWPENAGGTSNIKTVKAGQKIRIVLSKYTAPIRYYEDFHNINMYLFSISSIFKKSFGPIVSGNDYYDIIAPGNQYFISMIINQSHTQVLCQAGVCDYSGGVIKYDSLMPTTVIYESEEPIILGESNEVPQNIVDLFPTVEIEVPEDIIDGIICIERTRDNMPFELVD
ncbi:MAG: hypothetical protein KIG63_00275 [Methanobrevibacter sp.]|nr:hypothetical protein [Methanobrevibacter sp.]